MANPLKSGNFSVAIVVVGDLVSIEGRECTCRHIINPISLKSGLLSLKIQGEGYQVEWQSDDKTEKSSLSVPAKKKQFHVIFDTQSSIALRNY